MQLFARGTPGRIRTATSRFRRPEPFRWTTGVRSRVNETEVVVSGGCQPRVLEHADVGACPCTHSSARRRRKTVPTEACGGVALRSVRLGGVEPPLPGYQPGALTVRRQAV